MMLSKIVKLAGIYMLFGGVFMVFSRSGAVARIYERYLKKAYLAIGIGMVVVPIVLLISARCINLTADFPQGLTWSADIYTDEGGHCKNAIAYYLTGRWYITGDTNAAVNLPVMFLVQTLFFKIAGMSLTTARGITILFSVLASAAAYLFIRRWENERVAALSVLFAASNFVFLAYSRLAFMEIPALFFVFASMALLAYRTNSRNGPVLIVSSACVYLAALLTKTNVIFVSPVMIYIILKDSKFMKRNIADAAIFITTVLGGYVLYYLCFASRYQWDYRYLASLNLTPRLHFSFARAVRSVFEAVYRARVIDYILFPIVIISALFFNRLKKHPLFIVSWIWLAAFFMMMAVYGYMPIRYYILAVFPFSMLIAIILEHLITEGRSAAALTLMLAIIASLLFNYSSLVLYIRSPHYSLISMAKDVKKIMDEGLGPKEPKYLLGPESYTIGLATGIFGLGDDVLTRDMENIIKKYDPRYYVSIGEVLPNSLLYKHYHVSLVKRYDVFGNYTGKQAGLYRLTKKGEELR